MTMAAPRPTPISSAPSAPPNMGGEPSGVGGGFKAAITRKLGPLPVWAWAGIIGGAGLGYRLMRGGGKVTQEVPTTNITPGASPSSGFLNELGGALLRLEAGLGAIKDAIASAPTSGGTGTGGGTTPSTGSSGATPGSSPAGVSAPSGDSFMKEAPVLREGTLSAVSATPTLSLVQRAAETFTSELTPALQRVAAPVRPVSGGGNAPLPSMLPNVNVDGLYTGPTNLPPIIAPQYMPSPSALSVEQAIAIKREYGREDIMLGMQGTPERTAIMSSENAFRSWLQQQMRSNPAPISAAQFRQIESTPVPAVQMGAKSTAPVIPSWIPSWVPFIASTAPVPQYRSVTTRPGGSGFRPE